MTPARAPVLSRAYPQVFTRSDKRRRVILVPNLSQPFAEICAAVFRRHGFRSLALPLAGESAKRLGKRFTHNDICYPAQINIGEALQYLSDRRDAAGEYAVAFAKNCTDCRAGHYSALARKALDDAGYAGIPIVTTGSDSKKMHPGFRLGPSMSNLVVSGIAIIDAMEKMRLRIRPYEAHPGDTDRVFKNGLARVVEAIERRPRSSMAVLRDVVRSFNAVPLSTEERRPRVFVIGEILLNFHETANSQIVRYLEKNGLEVLLPDMLTFFRRDIVISRESVKKGLVAFPAGELLLANVKDFVMGRVENTVGRAMREFRFWEPHCGIQELASHAHGMVDLTHSAGEGWLIPAEIMEHALHGVRAFVIIQPFGCLPNQVTGKALIPALTKRLPGIHIVSVDYDADVSQANIENRLQMLIMAAKRAV